MPKQQRKHWDDFDKDKKVRGWCFVWNNYTEDKPSFACMLHDLFKMDFIIFGAEIAPTTGTPHYQGYFYSHSAWNMWQILEKSKDWGWTLSHARGSQKHNRVYCGKDMDFYLYGEVDDNQGRRTDIQEVKEMVIAKKPLVEIWAAARSMQSYRMAEIGIQLLSGKRDWKTVVHWFWGPGGTGKTQKAYEMCVDPWECGDNLKWFTGYRDQEDVIIDDFRADYCSFPFLLKLLDRYPLPIEIKGTGGQFLAKRIFITCPYPPQMLFERSNEDMFQLMRRIECVLEFKKSETKTETKSQVGNIAALDSPMDLKERFGLAW